MRKQTLWLVGFILLKFILQYALISPVYDLQRDEYLHLDQANHLAWGYLSVPPLTSWISWIIRALGNSVFWVKFFPALFGVLTMVIVWKTVEELGGNLYAQALSAICITFSVLLPLNTLFQPNSMDVLCWTGVYYCLIKYLNTTRSKWLLIGAAVFAMGFLNKYNIGFLLLGLLPAILITRQRRMLAQPSFYMGALIVLLMILPNLMWQYYNGFPVIKHMHKLARTQLVHVNPMDFLKAQLFFFIGSFIVMIAAFYALLFYKPFRAYRLFLWSFLFTLAIFLYLKAKSYYTIGLYPIYLSFGAVFLAHVTQTQYKRILRSLLIIVPLVLFIPLYEVAFPNRSPQYIVKHPQLYQKLGMLRWEDGLDHPLPQDFADMLGWRELARKVDSVYAKMPNPESTLVLCDNYGEAGAINYYTTRGIRAVSFNADYINWFNLNRSYTNLIRVKEHEDSGKELGITAPYFQAGLAADSITNPYAREHGTTIFSFTNARVNINPRIRNEILKVKNEQ